MEEGTRTPCPLGKPCSTTASPLLEATKSQNASMQKSESNVEWLLFLCVCVCVCVCGGGGGGGEGFFKVTHKTQEMSMNNFPCKNDS